MSIRPTDNLELFGMHTSGLKMCNQEEAEEGSRNIVCSSVVRRFFKIGLMK